MRQRSQRLRRIHTDEVEFADGPTVLPEPWSPPPDPDFLTGTLPRLERVDLSGGPPPGFEPSDSSQQTVRFSREAVAEAQALAPRKLPRASGTNPRRPARRLFRYDGPLLHLTIAFSLGLLTGILAMS